MKLKQLTIHNIASIEDAFIDFDGPELRDQNLFLICGETGSGKTTILDSICLALFNTAPRISNASKEVIDPVSQDQRVINDVREMMRQNSVEAWATLTFIDIYGKECKAEWRIRRKIDGRGKVDAERFKNESYEEKLRREAILEWSFTDGDGTTYYKVKEVAAKIIEAIGMTYLQFCRTTMLAQGEFTKFLNSEGTEKALILEKLVGTDIYTKVGIQINTSKREMDEKVKLLQKELDNMRFLSADEKAERLTNIETLGAEAKELGEKSNAIDAKLQWIASKAAAEQEVATATANLAQAEDALQQEDAVNGKRDVNLWDATADVRNAMKAKEKCVKDAESQADEKKRLAKDYATNASGLNFLIGKCASLKAAIAAQEEAAEKQERFEEMFGNASLICSAHAEAVACQKFIAENEPQLKKYDDEIAQLNAALATHTEARDKANAEIKEAEDEANKLERQLKEIGAEGIGEEVRQINELKLNIQRAENDLKLWSKAKDDMGLREKELAEATKQQTALQVEAKAKEDALQKAEDKLKASKSAYEKMKASMEDHAKVLRAELKAGDTCPVCGNTVDKVLSDDAITKILNPIKEQADNDEAERDGCRNAYMNAKTEATAANAAVKNAKKEHDAAAKLLKEAAESAAKHCANIGLKDFADAAERLPLLKEEASNTETAIAERQKQIAKLQGSKDEAAKLVSNLRRNKLNPAQKAMDADNKAIGDKKAAKERLNGKIEENKKTLSEKLAYISDAVNPDWQPSDESKRYEELKSAADAYFKLKDKLKDDTTALTACSADISNAQASKAAILGSFSDWSEYDSAAPAELPNITKRWGALQSQVAALVAKMESTAADMGHAQADIAAFYDEHPDVQPEAVNRIATFNNKEVEGTRAWLERLTKAQVTAKANMDTAAAKLAQLPTCPLAEGDDKESLMQAKDAIAEKASAKQQEIGRITKELEDDELNRATHGERKEQLDALNKELNEWIALDKYFGPADGKNFRNIAQSFILGDMLEKANAYLSTISGRYRLFCKPGSLTIMLRDAYQRDVERPTNTLSGGESFMVSLALALSLSDMRSSGFDVDTLFIDEGFGTLSPDYLDSVINTLQQLYKDYGRRVGIISHVEMLRQRIPVTIQVSREGNSASRVEILRS